MGKRSPDPVMRFGKYKGKPASEIPVEYLDWLIGEPWLYPELREQLVEHLYTRPEWLRMEDAATE